MSAYASQYAPIAPVPARQAGAPLREWQVRGRRRLAIASALFGLLVVVAVSTWFTTTPNRPARAQHADPSDFFVDKAEVEDGCSGIFCIVVSASTQAKRMLGIYTTTTTTTTTRTTTTLTTTTLTTTYTGTSTTTSTTTTSTTTSSTTTTTESTTTTSSSTSTTLCRAAFSGSHCHDLVVASLRNLQDRGLPSNASLYEDIQTELSHDLTTECHLPCPCQIAEEGDTCYDRVSYAMYAGIRQHPEWYSGLHNNSKFGAVQAHLHEFDEAANCSMPCVDALAEALTLFCFSIIRPNYEYDIVKNQFAWNAGIFACDGYSVLSPEKLEIGWSLKGPVETILFNPAPVGTSKDGTAANAQLFMQAWDVVRIATPYDQYDWTIKVDPDAVLLPDRLRVHLTPYKPGSQLYVKNCNKWPGQVGWPMMFGSVELYSLAAIKAYFENVEVCKKNLPWESWGEDYFMNQCFDHVLKVNALKDDTLLSDKVCRGVDCSDGFAAVFHPFKTRDAWMDCWKKASPESDDLMLPHQPPPLPILPARAEGKLPRFARIYRGNDTNHTKSENRTNAFRADESKHTETIRVLIDSTHVT